MKRLCFLVFIVGTMMRTGYAEEYSFSNSFIQKTKNVSDIATLYKLSDSEIEKLVIEADSVISNYDSNFLCFKAALENKSTACSDMENYYWLLGRNPQSCKTASINCKAMWIKLHVKNDGIVSSFLSKGGCNSCPEKEIGKTADEDIYKDLCKIFDDKTEYGPFDGTYQRKDGDTQYRAVRKGYNVCICLSDNDSKKKTFTFDPNNSFNYAKQKLQYFRQELSCANYKKQVSETFITACANVCAVSVTGVYTKDNYNCTLESDALKLTVVKFSESK